MFQRARLKLTAWYLLIIMLVSVIFSLVIFRLLSAEVERFERVQRIRIEHGLQNRVLVPIRLSNPELVEETKGRILFILIIVNSGVFLVSGGLGYFLAGVTLRPIKKMMDEQNQFVSDASHELRTPLTSLKSAFEVFLRGHQPSLKEAKTLALESITEVNKLQSLSESLLQLAQYQKPGTTRPFARVTLADVISQAVRKIEPVARKKAIKIKFNPKNLVVAGDKDSLVNLVVILLDNAIKYSPNNKEISISTGRTDGSVLISVSDQGVGIDPKDLPRIFDRFYRTDSARSRDKLGGYGLGLSIAKKIVESHKGSIQVESRLHKGSTFIIHLPTGNFS